MDGPNWRSSSSCASTCSLPAVLLVAGTPESFESPHKTWTPLTEWKNERKKERKETTVPSLCRRLLVSPSLFLSLLPSHSHSLTQFSVSQQTVEATAGRIYPCSLSLSQSTSVVVLFTCVHQCVDSCVAVSPLAFSWHKLDSSQSSFVSCAEKSTLPNFRRFLFQSANVFIFVVLPFISRGFA